MSSTLTKKQQKSQSFRTKGPKGNKKEPRIPDDVPEQDLLDDDHEDEVAPTIAVTDSKVEAASAGKETETTEADGKKKSKSKLSKEKKLREKLAREAEAAGGAGSATTTAATGDKKRKRDDLVESAATKAEKGKNKAADAEAEGDEAKEAGAEGEVKEKKKTKKDIKQRFILFVGKFSNPASSYPPGCVADPLLVFLRSSRPPLIQDHLIRSGRLLCKGNRPLPLRPTANHQTHPPRLSTQISWDRIHRVSHFYRLASCTETPPYRVGREED